MEENPLTSLDPEVQGLLSDALTFAESLLQPWRFYQVLIVLGLFVVAHLAAKWAHPRLEGWIRSREGLRASQLRFLVLLLRRLRGIFFALSCWATYLVMQQATWPSRSFLIGIVATLVSAWVIVAIATRLIRNPLLRGILRWAALIYVTLSILDLTTQASEILDGIAFSFGETRLSALLILKAIATLFIFLGVAGWASAAVQRRLQANENLSPSLRVLTAKVLRILFYAIAVVIALQSIGFDLTSLTVLSGAIGLGIGFGLQKVVSNLVSGLIVLLDKSIKPGDVITLGDTFGWVTQLNARYVGVNTRDGREYLIPNEDLITTQVVNWTHSDNLVRLDIFFGVSYDSDPHQVRKLAREAAAGVDRVVATPAPVCHIVGFGDSSIDFILRFWITDPSGGLTNVRGNVFLALWDTLKEAEIEIPFPRRDVTLLNQPQVPMPDLNPEGG